MDRRWTDDRLDDRFAEIRREMDRLALIADALVEVPGKLADVAASNARCHEGIQAINTRMDERDEQRAEERLAAYKQRELEQAAAAAERKRDRRWIVGTLLTVGGLIVASIAVLQGFIG